MPAKNQKDISEIPAKVRRVLDIRPVEHMDQVLELAFARRPRKARKRATRAKTKAKTKTGKKARA